eukprot:8112532-Karenia_brevis.AAC.1
MLAAPKSVGEQTCSDVISFNAAISDQVSEVAVEVDGPSHFKMASSSDVDDDVISFNAAISGVVAVDAD